MSFHPDRITLDYWDSLGSEIARRSPIDLGDIGEVEAKLTRLEKLSAELDIYGIEINYGAIKDLGKSISVFEADLITIRAFDGFPPFLSELKPKENATDPNSLTPTSSDRSTHNWYQDRYYYTKKKKILVDPLSVQSDSKILQHLLDWEEELKSAEFSLDSLKMLRDSTQSQIATVKSAYSYLERGGESVSLESERLAKASAKYLRKDMVLLKSVVEDIRLELSKKYTLFSEEILDGILCDLIGDTASPSIFCEIIREFAPYFNKKEVKEKLAFEVADNWEEKRELIRKETNRYNRERDKYIEKVIKQEAKKQGYKAEDYIKKDLTQEEVLQLLQEEAEMEATLTLEGIDKGDITPIDPECEADSESKFLDLELKVALAASLAILNSLLVHMPAVLFAEKTSS